MLKRFFRTVAKYYFLSYSTIFWMLVYGPAMRSFVGQCWPTFRSQGIWARGKARWQLSDGTPGLGEDE